MAKAKKPAKKKVVSKKTAKKSALKKAMNSVVKKPTKKAAPKKAAKAKAAPKKKATKAVTKKAVTKKVSKKKAEPTAKKVVKPKKVAKKTQKAAKHKELGMTKTENKTKIEPQQSAASAATLQPTIMEDKKLDTTMDEMDYIDSCDVKSDANYMQDEQREYFRKILIRWKQQLMSEVDSTMGHMQEDGLSFPDPIDRAAQEEGFNLELRTRDRERKLIKKIESALDMIETGDYGYCEDCGADIGVRRLEARPTATKCIDCKTYAEIREKQSGGQ
jgi:DnaK suppressor protein